MKEFMTPTNHTFTKTSVKLDIRAGKYLDIKEDPIELTLCDQSKQPTCNHTKRTTADSAHPWGNGGVGDTREMPIYACMTQNGKIDLN